jgi:uncharacterized membrane protein YfhO
MAQPLISDSSNLLLWNMFIIAQITISVTLFFYLLLSKHRNYFKTIEYLLLLFFPVIGIAYIFSTLVMRRSKSL